MQSKSIIRAKRGKHSKRQHWKAGAVVEIPLDDGYWAYGQLGDQYVIAVFDGYFTSRPVLEQIIHLPILFKCYVYKDVVSKGYWVKVFQLEPRDDVIQEDYFFKQDSFSGALSLYHSDFSEHGWEKPAILSECIGLECAAVWEADHVEDRISDTRKGMQSDWVNQLAIDISKVPKAQIDIH